MIHLGVLNCSQLKKYIALMQELFPVLKSLGLEADEEMWICPFSSADFFARHPVPTFTKASLVY